jgi:hypothetical protein
MLTTIGSAAVFTAKLQEIAMRKSRRWPFGNTTGKQSQQTSKFDVGNQVGSNINNIGRDQKNYRNSYHSDNPYAWVTGVGRLLLGVGVLLAFIGFGLVGYPIVLALASSGYTQPDLSSLPLGFGLTFVGIVIANVGMFISGGRRGGNR